MLRSVLIASSAFALLACADATTSSAEPTPAAQDATAKVAEPKLKTTDLGGGFYVLFGPGGNIGLSVGDDGVYMIDDKFADSSAEILERVAEITDQPIRYVLNTHHHGDHTGANAQIKATGATIMAHDNVRKRMSTAYKSSRSESGMSQPTEAALWPVLTFSDTATLHVNGQTVKAIHVPHGHTDGDSLIHFPQANIIHMGDNFFHGMFPYIDMDSGGHMDGMIAAHETALKLVNANTKIIPGHGPMASQADLTAARDLLVEIRARVKKQIDAGKTLEQIIAAKPLTDKSDLNGFIKEYGIITFAYNSIKNPQ